VLEALDEGLDGRALAARAMLSPFHFNRLVRAGIGEPPAAFRRRLLLERAAWQLGRGASVIEASLDAGYAAVEGPEPDVRTMLDRTVFTKEVWTAAIAGRDFPTDRDCSITGQQARLAAVQPQFNALVRRIRDRNEWDDVFVDALCTPRVSFTFGSVIAHILDVSIVRRHNVIGVLRELGVRDVETRDPIEWERLIATRGEPRQEPCASE
jgi:AraC-like DNA-binding protein